MSKTTSKARSAPATAPVEPVTDAEKQIVKYLSPLILEHKGLASALEMVRTAMQQNASRSERAHVVIAGESGCGKTTLADMIAAEAAATGDGSTGEFRLGLQRHKTALVSTIPSPVTPKSTAIELYRALGEQGNIHGTTQEITARLLHQFKQSDVEIVLLDEHQHLFSLGLNGKYGRSKNLRQAMDWIKSLINKTEITFVLMGMPDLRDLIRSDEQLNRRFSTQIYLKPFDRPRRKDSELAAFADDLLLSTLIDLKLFDDFEEFKPNEQNAQSLYLATRGVPGLIKDLVMRAACLAARKGDRVITMEHFAQTYCAEEALSLEIRRVRAEQERIEQHRRRVVTGKPINPFTLPSHDLLAAMGSAKV